MAAHAELLGKSSKAPPAAPYSAVNSENLSEEAMLFILFFTVLYSSVEECRGIGWKEQFHTHDMNRTEAIGTEQL